MQFHEGGIYHIYNRGNDKQPIFFADKNYWFFTEKIRKHISPCCDILAWCLMPNHFHLLIHANELTGKPKKVNPVEVSELSARLGLLLSAYSKAINVQEKRTGNLFQQRTKSKPVNSAAVNYALTAFYYIHQNPLKAGLAKRLEDWPFSSFNQYAGTDKNGLCNVSIAKELLDLNPQIFITDSYSVLKPELVRHIF